MSLKGSLLAVKYKTLIVYWSCSEPLYFQLLLLGVTTQSLHLALLPQPLANPLSPHPFNSQCSYLHIHSPKPVLTSPAAGHSYTNTLSPFLLLRLKVAQFPPAPCWLTVLVVVVVVHLIINQSNPINQTKPNQCGNLY